MSTHLEKNLLKVKMNTRLTTLALGLVLSVSTSLHAQNVATVISSNLFEPNSVAVDANNIAYLTDGANNRIMKYDPSTAAATLLAGNIAANGTNNGLGASARFFQPAGIVYARGGLVVADSGNQLLRFVTLNGVVSNLAGVYSSSGGYVEGAANSAQFSFPLGLATDANGNIYIADSGNNAIRVLDTNNVVSTYKTGFYQPSAVAVGDNGDLWVADTRNDMIVRVDSNKVATVMAGAKKVVGTDDGLPSTDARLNLPSGLLWVNTATGLLISDTGNNTIRRLYYDNAAQAWSLQTVAGQAGQAGELDGNPNTAKFNAPLGLTFDVQDSGFYIVDNSGNALRRLQTSAPQPAVSDPALGWVDFPPNNLGERLSVFKTVVQSVFNNDVIIAVKTETGVKTYITSGPTPTNAFVDTIPTPGPITGTTPPTYIGDNLPASECAPTIVGPLPDLTIKAICMADGRRPSSVVSARYQFQVGNPVIYGTNGYFLQLSNITSGAMMYYTIDGSDPTNDPTVSLGPVANGDFITLPFPTNSFVLKVRGYKNNYVSSGVVGQTLSPTNFIANNLTFGFGSGEASSQFIAAAGQRFYAPVTLTLLGGQKMYSLQFNATVTNLTGPAVGTTFDFRSFLEKPTSNGVFTIIPPAMFDGTSVSGMVFTNTSENLLGVGWFERFTQTNLYNSQSQDLITYSQPHDTQFLSAKGKVVLGGYSFVVPTSAAMGQTYQIQLDRPSASANGINQSAIILAPTNGAIKTVTVGSIPYVVGSVAPFQWFNAGDFGDGTINNVDVLQVFQSAVYGFNSPPPGSDFFDAMDSSNGGSSSLDGDDTLINNIMTGDQQLQVDDIYVTFRRSLDPSLTWYARYWSNGVLNVVPVANIGTGSMSASSKQAVAPKISSSPRWANVAPDDIQAPAGSTVQIPVRASIAGNLPIRVMAVNIDVQGLDGSPIINSQVLFAPAAGLGSPTFSASQGAGNTAGAWLDSTVAGVSGTNILGMLTVSIPTNATASSAWKVHFSHLSVSPNGVGLFPLTIQDALITTANRSGSSWGDGIPDSWRLRWFGSVSNLLSGANLDPDGDGHSNYAEYVAGTNPLDGISHLNVTCPSGAFRSALTWPSVFGKKYSVECSSTLFGGSWSSIATNLPGTGQPQQFADPNPANVMRFYRVKVQ